MHAWSCRGPTPCVPRTVPADIIRPPFRFFPQHFNFAHHTNCSFSVFLDIRKTATFSEFLIGCTQRPRFSSLEKAFRCTTTTTEKVHREINFTPFYSPAYPPTITSVSIETRHCCRGRLVHVLARQDSQKTIHKRRATPFHQQAR